MTITAPRAPEAVPHGAATTDTTRRLGRRAWRGRPDDPAWVRPGLLGLLVATAVLYLWDLSESGWANSFYAAAVQAGTHSWKAFLFGSSDASNFITVDKPPAALWVMEISARIFGLDSWSLLVPQAIEGVAAVGLLYLAVRRVAGPGAGLLAGAVLAITPVAALMFRFDNPDSLLVLLLVGAAYATTRYLDAGRARWLVLAGGLVGVGFITKSLQTFIVVPVLAAVVLAVSAQPLRRRLRDLLLGGLALVVAGGWWVAVVELTPASDRPYIGGSQDNSLWNVIFGYNGFGRLTGNESGSVGGGGAGGSGWGPTGLTRLFNTDFGGQISWLLPSALVLLVVGLGLTARRRRTDPGRAGLLIWGGWLVLTGLVFSLSKGIIHPYYTVALAPAIAALVGIGAALAWSRRSSLIVRVALAASVGVGAVWSYELLRRSPSWHPWLRDVVLAGGLAAAVGLVLLAHRGRPLRAGFAAAAAAACLAAPFASTLDTVTTAHTGAIPSAGPAVAGSFGPGGGFGGGRGGFGGGRGGFGGGRAVGGTHSFGGTRSFGGSRSFGGARASGGAGPSIAGGAGPSAFGGSPSGRAGGLGRAGSTARGTVPGAGAGGFAFHGGGGGAGGILGSSTPSAALVTLLQANHSAYSWVAATTGSENASGYQLATDDPVMSIGGFNGTDPAPSLAAFETYVREGRIHYYIAGSGGFGGSSSGDDATRIQTWVASHFTSRTVGGVTVYDLTARS